MELKEREQVVKDLQEIVDNYSGSWQRFNVLDGALTLIKELTEKTEEYCRECAELRVVLYEITDEVNQIKADVVRKMQELTKVNLDKYGNKLDGYSIVDQTAKEMLED